MATGQVAEQVAEGLEEAAEITRQVDTGRVGFFIGGLGVGFVVGFVMGYRWNREKIRAEEIKKADEEIDKIRAVLMERYSKPPVEAVVEELGYSVAVTEEELEEEKRSLKPPVPVSPHTRPVQRPVQFPKRREPEPEKSKNDGWDYDEEIAKRTPHRPYVIHQDEFKENEKDYTQVTWTFYARDRVLVDEHDAVVSSADETVGRESLKMFGHGADDVNVVFVRNDRIEMEWEICRVPYSYEESVLGITNDDDSS